MYSCVGLDYSEKCEILFSCLLYFITNKGTIRGNYVSLMLNIKIVNTFANVSVLTKVAVDIETESATLKPKG